MNKAFTKSKNVARSIGHHYRLFELRTEDLGTLPNPPSDTEKYMYAKRHTNFLMIASVISFVCVSISLSSFIIHHPWLWILIFCLLLNILYFVVSMIVNMGTTNFNLSVHRKLVKAWRPDVYPNVDIFLPTAGEDIRVIENTWKGVQALADSYIGKVTVYALDDGDSPAVKDLADRYGFVYEVRPDRGYFKKAGNLRHGYRISSARFVAIFDADFTPRKDFLYETLPYFMNRKIGIVQTPQYFDVSTRQNWLERGAGAVQELFYRFSQVSRQSYDASICVGSNAVYRREALRSVGGTALIEHSEDVHTGFDLRLKNWEIQYIPVILAKGLCPATMEAFFKQQYRWCLGSMSLLSSPKFHSAKMSFRTRLSYYSGFLYYIHTGLMSFYTPILPLILLGLLPSQIQLANYTLILPSLIFTQIIFPVWHKSIYGVEAWATRAVCGWAHFIAIADHLRHRPMGWQPTGSKISRNYRYTMFRALQVVFNFIPAILWIGLGMYHLILTESFAFVPITISGIYYFLITVKVTTGMDPRKVPREVPLPKVSESPQVTLQTLQ